MRAVLPAGVRRSISALLPISSVGGFLLAVFDRPHQRRAPLLVGDAAVRTLGQQQFDRGNVAAVRGMPDGGAALIVFGIDRRGVAGIHEGDGVADRRRRPA